MKAACGDWAQGGYIIRGKSIEQKRSPAPKGGDLLIPVRPIRLGFLVGNQVVIPEGSAILGLCCRRCGGRPVAGDNDMRWRKRLWSMGAVAPKGFGCKETWIPACAGMTKEGVRDAVL